MLRTWPGRLERDAVGRIRTDLPARELHGAAGSVSQLEHDDDGLYQASECSDGAVASPVLVIGGRRRDKRPRDLVTVDAERLGCRQPLGRAVGVAIALGEHRDSVDLVQA